MIDGVRTLMLVSMRHLEVKEYNRNDISILLSYIYLDMSQQALAPPHRP